MANGGDDDDDGESLPLANVRRGAEAMVRELREAKGLAAALDAMVGGGGRGGGRWQVGERRGVEGARGRRKVEAIPDKALSQGCSRVVQAERRSAGRQIKQSTSGP